MTHWQQVGSDIWSMLRWFIPPFMFYWSGRLDMSGADDNRILSFLVFWFGMFVFVINGWWV